MQLWSEAMPCRKSLVAACGLLLSAALPVSHAQEFSNLDTRLVGSGFVLPLYATAPLSDGNVFVVEKGGTIKRVNNGVSNNFLSISVATGGEQGLLGLAFDPGYADPASTGYRRFFVSYIASGTRDSVIASWRSSIDGLSVDPNSRVEVMRWDQPDQYSNHKGGWIGFKPGDANHLFISTGDGGGGNDPLNSGQRLDTVLGKMLRIDVNGDDFASTTVNYAIPDDNPFVGTAGARGEIFAFGLRNAWRNGFDSLTGDLWIGDVGQNQREEVDFIRANSAGGQNFGWRIREGDIATPGINDPIPPGTVFTDPILTYNHNEGQSITGGYVVRDPGSELDGWYVFGDFVNGRVWAVPAEGGPLSFDDDAIELSSLLDAGAGGVLGNVSSFGQGANGELFIVDYGGKVVQVLAVVPEPGTVALMVAGVLAVVARRCRAAR
jgi:Glucose / Sorbosone dehydrogenase